MRIVRLGASSTYREWIYEQDDLPADWLKYVRPNQLIYLVKENQAARVTEGFDGNRIKHTRTSSMWFVRPNGQGFDQKDLLLPFQDHIDFNLKFDEELKEALLWISGLCKRNAHVPVDRTLQRDLHRVMVRSAQLYDHCSELIEEEPKTLPTDRTRVIDMET